jgi:hypothetical protein
MHLSKYLSACVATVAAAATGGFARARRTGVRRLLAGLLLAGTAWAAAPFSEYQVKAVYLFNFGQFVEWPEDAFASPSSPFVICIVGKDPFDGMLENVVRGESLGAHPIEVQQHPSAGEAKHCNILFVGRAEAARLPETVAALRGRSVLTVTDVAGGEREGAMIVLVTENNRVRMRINPSAAKASRLTISSKLLRPAEIVGPGGGP